MTELLPCPWCGAAARPEPDTDGSVCVEVDHEPECYLTASDTRRWFYADEHGRSAEEAAASEWNLRAYVVAGIHLAAEVESMGIDGWASGPVNVGEIARRIRGICGVVAE